MKNRRQLLNELFQIGSFQSLVTSLLQRLFKSSERPLPNLTFPSIEDSQLQRFFFLQCSPALNEWYRRSGSHFGFSRNLKRSVYRRVGRETVKWIDETFHLFSLISLGHFLLPFSLSSSLSLFPESTLVSSMHQRFRPPSTNVLVRHPPPTSLLPYILNKFYLKLVSVVFPFELKTRKRSAQNKIVGEANGIRSLVFFVEISSLLHPPNWRCAVLLFVLVLRMCRIDVVFFAGRCASSPASHELRRQWGRRVHGKEPFIESWISSVVKQRSQSCPISSPSRRPSHCLDFAKIFFSNEYVEH